MANDLLSTDLDALHIAIRDQIAKQYPCFRTVRFYKDDESEDMATPACLLELTEMESEGYDPGTGQLNASLRFSARLVFSREHSAAAPLQIRLAAASLAAYLQHRRFSGCVSPARFLNASEDFLRPDIPGKWCVWRIEWVHEEAMFGRNVWINDGSVQDTPLAAGALH